MKGLRTALAVAAITAFGLVGYAQAHDEPHAPGAPNGHTAAGLLSATNVDGPKTAKHLRIGIWNSASNITVYHIGASWNDWVLYLLYDKLLEPSPYLSKGRSWLATEVVPVTPDNRVWEAEIRPGVKWHDGTELTADDIVFTYEYYRDGPTNRWTHHVSQVPKIDRIELVSPTRVRFTSEFPMPNFDLVTAPEMPIFQKKQWETIEDPRTFTGIPIGTGPYKLVDFRPDEYYHFVAHEDYWLGRPLVDELTLIMIKDPQTMFAALKTGEIDGAARAVPPELVDEWINDPAIAVVQAPTLWGTWINFNLNQELFNDRDLRHALSVAIDPDELVERVMMGRAQSGKHGWPHLDSTWTKPGMEIPFVQEEAKAGLDKLGFVDADGDGFRDLPDGTPLDLRIIVSTNEPLFVRAAELVQGQFANVGIKTHVMAVDAATFADLRSGGDYEFYIADITPHGVADQDQYMQFYNAPEMRRLLDDEPERLALYEKWWAAETRDARLQASFELQEYENRYPSRFMLWYPDGLFAYRPDSYDNYASSFGYGIYHKYSFLPDGGRAGTAESIDHLLELED